MFCGGHRAAPGRKTGSFINKLQRDAPVLAGWRSCTGCRCRGNPCVCFTSGVPMWHRQPRPRERPGGMCTGSPPMCSEGTRRAACPVLAHGHSRSEKESRSSRRPRTPGFHSGNAGSNPARDARTLPGIAQQVERRVEGACVGGSKPSSGTSQRLASSTDQSTGLRSRGLHVRIVREAPVFIHQDQGGAPCAFQTSRACPGRAIQSFAP